MRRTIQALAAYGAALAALTLCAVPSPAFAGGKRASTNQRKTELVRPARAPDADAEGKIRVRTKKGTHRVMVRLKHLEPGGTYTVHDADTDELLGTTVANRKGKARLKLRIPVEKPGKVETKPVNGDVDVVVRAEGTDAFILVGGPNDGIDLGDARFGDGFYGTLSSANLSVSLFSDGDGHDSFVATLQATTAAGNDVYELYFDTIGGKGSGDGGLPLEAEGVEDLAGRAFDVVDADGDEVVAGDLPELESLKDLLDGDLDFAIPALGEGDSTEFTAPFTLRIAAGDDALTEVGEFQGFDIMFPEDFRVGCVHFGDFDGAGGTIGLFADAHGESINVSLWVPDTENAAGRRLYLWDASSGNYGDDLPLGVDSVDDLSGRAFELRNGTGTAFVTGELPELTDEGFVLFEPAGNARKDGTGDSIEPGAGPYTFWIANPQGTLTEVAELEEFDLVKPFPEPSDIRTGSLQFGEALGDGACVFLLSDGAADMFAVTIWRSNDRFGALYEYFGGTFDGSLPFDLESVDDLSGRAFEVTNGDDDVIFAGDLPELQDGFLDYDNFPAGGGSSLELGRPPYTLFVENGDSLVEVGEIAEIKDPVVISGR